MYFSSKEILLIITVYDIIEIEMTIRTQTTRKVKSLTHYQRTRNEHSNQEYQEIIQFINRSSRYNGDNVL